MYFCVEYRCPNQMTVGETYLSQEMEDYIDILGDSMVFKTLEDNCRYSKIPIYTEEFQKKWFNMNMGTYRYKRMPFGFPNPPETFQRFLDIIFLRLIENLSGIIWRLNGL